MRSLVIISLAFVFIGCKSSKEHTPQVRQEAQVNLGHSQTQQAKIPESKSSGSGAEPAVTQKVEVHKTDLTSVSEIPDFVESFKVTCEDKSSCPSFVGSLVNFKMVNNQINYGLCSFTLISDNQILTNDHCLSQKHFQTQYCSVIYALFPENSTYSESKVRCKRVLAYSDQYNLVQVVNEETVPLGKRKDWAILELETSVGRPSVATNTQGMPHLTQVNLYPTHYSRDKNTQEVQGVIKKVSCNFNMASRLARSYNHPYYPYGAMECDNKLIGGYSGSGVINSNNEVLAVFNSAAEPLDTKSFGKIFPINEKGGLVTNLHCIPSINRGSLSPACDDSGPQNTLANDHLSYVFGWNIDQEAESKYLDFINANPAVQWEDTSLNSIINFGVEGFTRQAQGVQNFNLIKEDYLIRKFPKLPHCISQSAGVNKFLVEVPYFESHRIETSVSKASIRKVPVKVRSIEYMALFDAQLNQFSLRVNKIQDIDEFNRFINYRNEFIFSLDKCTGSQELRDCTAPLQTAYDNYEAYLEDAPYSQSSYYSRMHVGMGELIDEHVVNIPVCQ